MYRSLSLATLALAGVSSVSAITASNAEDSYTALMQWYDPSIGLWIPSTGWWNSANCLTVIAHLSAIDPVVNSQAQKIFPVTYTQAQKYNMQMAKVVAAKHLPETYYGNVNGHKHPWPQFPHDWGHHHHWPKTQQTNGFLNDYYDDEGWWGLAWVAAFDVTNNGQYLSTSQQIFEDMKAVWGTTPCGGIWWDKAHTYVNAIANELFLDLAAHLANRASGSNRQYYLDWATKQWQWFQASGMINAQNTVNDGLTSDCKNNGGTTWSYNQGVILGGLSELTRATGDSQYTDEAQRIADAAISALSQNGILHDPCEPNCGADGSQFKGVFMRNLQILQKQIGGNKYHQYLANNANSIWATDRDTRNELNLIWSGGNAMAPNASTQSSAMDAIVAALGTM